jgi:hypothetical protein
MDVQFSFKYQFRLGKCILMGSLNKSNKWSIKQYPADIIKYCHVHE